MTTQSVYQAWKPAVGKIVGDGQCVSLVINNSAAYVEALWPGTSWTNIIASVVGAKSLLTAANPAYFYIIENDHNDPNQLPEQGDIMVFDATPEAGYTNTFVNPYGHCGICDSATSAGFYLAQQNAPATGQGFNVTEYNWKFRPCLGWLRPKLTADPTPTPPAQPAGHTIYLPPTTGPWHLYPEGGPYTYAAAKGLLYPSQFGGLTYKIIADQGNGIYTIQTQDYGVGDIYTRGSDVIIS